MNSWTCENALDAQLLTPIEMVVLRNLKDFACPPQAIISMGVSLLTYTVEVAIAALPAVYCFIDRGVAPTLTTNAEIGNYWNTLKRPADSLACGQSGNQHISRLKECGENLKLKATVQRV